MNLKTIFIRLIVLNCLAFTPISNASEIKPYKISYLAEYTFLLPFDGIATKELTQADNGTWVISNTVTASMFTLNESSIFKINDSEIIPLKYEFKQNSFGKNKHTLLNFDWGKKQVAAKSNKKGNLTYELPFKTLDKLTYQLQLRKELMATKKLSEYLVADKNRLKSYEFEVLGKEIINTELGKLNTIKIQRIRDKKSKRNTLIWLAEDWDYLVVQLHQTEKGKLYKIKVAQASLNGTPITGISQ